VKVFSFDKKVVWLHRPAILDHVHDAKGREDCFAKALCYHNICDRNSRKFLALMNVTQCLSALLPAKRLLCVSDLDNKSAFLRRKRVQLNGLRQMLFEHEAERFFLFEFLYSTAIDSRSF